MEAHCPNVYLTFNKPFMIPCHLMTRTYKAKVKNMEQQRMAWYAIRQCSSSKHLTMYEHLINIVIYRIHVIHFLTLLVIHHRSETLAWLFCAAVCWQPLTGSSGRILHPQNIMQFTMHYIIMSNHKHPNMSTILCFVLHLQYNLNTQSSILFYGKQSKKLLFMYTKLKW